MCLQYSYLIIHYYTEGKFVIIEVRAKNCFAFDEAIAFSMKADMRNKKFG